jgi:alkylation response protein AidB-like acyl-CoA dehydrogenase
MSAVDDDARTSLLTAARALVPRIQACADQIEHDRQLPAPLVEALAEAGLFRMLLPRALDGYEVDPATFACVVEEIAGADASTAWCLSQGSGCSMVAAYLERPVAWEMFGRDPRAVLAWGPGPARAVAVAGGYRVTGRWDFASGCRHATWLGGVCPIYEADGTPRRYPDGSPDSRTMLFPAASAEIIDVWHVSGLRGTGSDAFTVHDLFVPHERTARRDDPAERREPGPLYLFPLNCLYATGFASVALGTARTTLDAFVDLARGKTPRGAAGVLRDNAVVQAQVAQAEAHLRAARAFLYTTLAEIWEAVGRTGTVTMEQRVHIRLAATYAIHQAAQVVDTAYHAAGATAIFAANPFERRFRDVHAVTQQVQGRQAHYETVGKFIFGLEPDGPFL